MILLARTLDQWDEKVVGSDKSFCVFDEVMPAQHEASNTQTAIALGGQFSVEETIRTKKPSVATIIVEVTLVQKQAVVRTHKREQKYRQGK